MSLVEEQAAFLKDIRKLLDFADEQAFVVTGGELERTIETQAGYVRMGLEKSMDSPHLRKCAMVLNFFRKTADERYELIQTAEALERVGKFWEDLDPRNRWGGRQGKTIDALRFYRDQGGWPSSAVSTLTRPSTSNLQLEGVALADAARPVTVALPASRVTTPLLKRGSAEREAISRLQSLLVKLGKLESTTGVYDDKTVNAISDFQRANGLVADGITGEKTWMSLLSQTSDAQKNMAQRFIGDADFEIVAEKYDLELAAIKAVYKVESNGKGFVGDEPKILFEGHVFWQRLKKLGMRPETLTKGNEDILYPSWTKQFYVGGAAELKRLHRAEAIHRDAARESASWGLFQIMGYHWKDLGYDSIDDFVDCMRRHERDQLDAFCRFIERKKDHKGRTLVQLLKNKDWASFAYAYNGAGYRQNAYDDKLKTQYHRFHVASV